KFAQATQIVADVVHAFPQTSLGKEVRLSANSRNRKPDYLSPRRQVAKVTGDARHPEGTRGIEERFLPRVEMTTIPNLASLRLGERNIRIRDSSITEHLRRLHAMTNMLELVYG
ncbi:MAG: hypothetical protein ACXW48_22820, partial [Candidatus Binatia bacterium]